MSKRSGKFEASDSDSDSNSEAVNTGCSDCGGCAHKSRTVPNYTEIFDKKLKKKKEKNPIKNDKYGLSHPFRLAIVGGSGSGKTTAMCELILKLIRYQHLYIYARDLEECIYQGIMSTLDEIQQDNDLPEPLYTASDNPDDIINVADLNPSVRSVMIFDDMVSSVKARPRIFEHFLRGRKRNCSYIFISQSFYGIQREVRLNLSAVMLMKLNDVSEVTRISAMLSTDIPKKKFMAFYQKCIKKPFGFILYDMIARDIKMKYRCGFYSSLLS